MAGQEPQLHPAASRVADLLCALTKHSVLMRQVAMKVASQLPGGQEASMDF